MHKRLVPAARLGILGFVAAAFAACGDDNRAPALGLILDQQVIIGNTLSLVLTADDPDGDRLDFDVSGLPKTARVTPRAANEAVLVWSPLITDTQPGGRRYEVEVAVDDGRGGSARQSIGVVVYPTFGVPAFTLPAGIVVNLGQQDDLELLVEVKDDDSTEVEIALDEGPEGAKLQRADKKVAHFFWRPDDAQRQVAVHRAIFSARDESHAPITHVLTIVLLNAEKQSGCEGAPPTVAHAPPLDQTFAGSLALGASATDGQSQVQSMTLHWTRGDPNGAYTAIAMTRLSNDGPDWRATLDGQALGALPNDGALVHYYLEATDNDDPTGVSCDQTTRVPKAGFFTVGLYPPGAAFDACVDDPAEPDGSAGQAATVKPGVYAGRRLCGADLDLLGLDAPAGTTVVAALRWNEGDDMPAFDLVDRDGNTLVSGDVAEPGRLQLVYERPDDRPIYVAVAGGFGSRQSYTLELTVGATRCEDDAAEPDSQPGEARVLPRDTEVEQKICAGDSDYFRLSVAGGERVHIEAAFDHRYGDLDLELRAADGATVLASSTSEKSLEAVDWTAEGATDLLVRVYGVEGASNSYTIVAGDAVITGCEPDGLGDNATPESAVVLYQGVYEGFHACDEAAERKVANKCPHCEDIERCMMEHDQKACQKKFPDDAPECFGNGWCWF